MNKKTKAKLLLSNPLMLAYLLFLCICAFNYILCSITKSHFPMWSRIIVAVTISSYGFSLSSITKSSIRIGENAISMVYETKKYLLELYRHEKTSDSAYSIELTEDIKIILSETDDIIASFQMEQRKSNKSVFWSDTLSFLAFFCIMSFEWVYKIFQSSQEFLTLLAFVLLIGVEYFEPVILKTLIENNNNTIQKVQSMIDDLEEKRNGQAEDAHAE